MKITTAAVIVAFVAPFVYAHKTNPNLEAHQVAIYRSATDSDADLDEEVMLLPGWKNIDYSDWVFLSATSDKNRNSTITIGYFNQVKVIDKDLAAKAIGNKVPQ